MEKYKTDTGSYDSKNETNPFILTSETYKPETIYFIIPDHDGANGVLAQIEDIQVKLKYYNSKHGFLKKSIRETYSLFDEKYRRKIYEAIHIEKPSYTKAVEEKKRRRRSRWQKKKKI